MCTVTFPKHSAKHVPVCFLLHQRLGSKSDMHGIAQRFAQNGFFAVCFDAPNHGDRIVDSNRNKHWLDGNLTYAIDMYSQMIATHREVQTMLDCLPAKLGITFSTVALVGFSQGGHSSLLAFANEPRIDVCVSALSAGDYKQCTQLKYEYLSKVAQAKQRPELEPFQTLYPPALENVVEEMDPIHKLSTYSRLQRPLLMINGAKDKLVPAQCNRSVYEKIKQEYQGFEQKLKHSVYPDLKHQVSKEMIDECLEWVCRWTPLPSSNL